jgi:hypothetical protein
MMSYPFAAQIAYLKTFLDVQIIPSHKYVIFSMTRIPTLIDARSTILPSSPRYVERNPPKADRTFTQILSEIHSQDFWRFANTMYVLPSIPCATESNPHACSVALMALQITRMIFRRSESTSRKVLTMLALRGTSGARNRRKPAKTTKVKTS